MYYKFCTCINPYILYIVLYAYLFILHSGSTLYKIQEKVVCYTAVREEVM